MAYVKASKVGGKYVPQEAIKKSIRDKNEIFRPEEESTLGTIGRNIYKPIRESISTLGGMPSDIWNQLAGVINPIQEKVGPYLSVGGLESGGIPKIPEAFTSKGIRERVAVPLGEKLFGAGSQEEQPGFLEGVTERAAKWAPYTLGGAGLKALKGGAGGLSALSGLRGGLTTNLAQGLAGQSIKELGGGEIAQFIGESLTSFGAPIVSKLLGSATKRATKRISEGLASSENRLWSDLDLAAAKKGKVNVSGLEKSLANSRDKLSNTVVKTNREPIQSIITETGKLIAKDAAEIPALIGTRKKIGSAFSTSKDPNARSILIDMRNAVDEQIGKHLGNLQLDAAKATVAKKNFQQSTAYKQLIDKTTKEFSSSMANTIGDVITKVAPYGFGVASAALRKPFMLLGIPAIRMVKNVSLILKNKPIMNAALKALKKIGIKNAIITTSEYAKRKPKTASPVKYVKYTG